MFWALLRAHVNPLLTAQAKMILARAKISLSQAHYHKLYCFILMNFPQE